VLDSIREPALLQNTEHLKRATVLLETSRLLLYQIRAAGMLAKLTWDTLDIIASIKNDPATASFVDATRNLVADLLLDKEGRLTFKPEVLVQMRNLVLSMVIQQLRTIPVPQIKGHYENYDYELRDLNVTTGDLLPDWIHIKVENDMALNTKELTTETAQANITIKVTNMRTNIENLKFWFRREGVVNIEDSGTADVGIKGEGASITIELKFDFKNRRPGQNLFKVTAIECDLNDISVHVTESKYDWIINALTWIFKNNLKQTLEESIEGTLRSSIEHMELQMSQMVHNISVEKMKESMQSVAASVSSAAHSVLPSAVSMS